MLKNNKATLTIIALNVLVFSIMYWRDPNLGYVTMVDFGAKVNFRIVDGNLVHLIMPMFMHASLPHLLFNCYALFLVGPLVESFYGTNRYVMLYLMMGVIATLGSFIFSNAVAVGASGAIYGLLAFHIYLYMKNRTVYKELFGMQMLLVIGINLIYTFMDPNIDKAGHVVGLAAGLIFYALFDRSRRHRLPAKPLASLLLMVILALGFWKYTTYKDSEHYFVFKYAYYAEKGELEKARAVEQQYNEIFINENPSP